MGRVMSLFEDDALFQGQQQQKLCTGAFVLRGFAFAQAMALHEAVSRMTVRAPFRNMVTPGGFCMSVAMTNCGSYGWISDSTGYRYDAIDPQSGQPWPRMPEIFMALAQSAAAVAGFQKYVPDACLINRYDPGTRLSMHQDMDERDKEAPIVSVSLGIPAVFLWGGMRRQDEHIRIPLFHGDVVVWGGPARFRYHGVLPIKEECHTLTGRCRINLTFRKVMDDSQGSG